MAFDLNVQVEKDLEYSVEGEWGNPTTFTDPDGLEYPPIKTQVIRSYMKFDPKSGDSVVVEEPVITARRSSFTRVPQPGENWLVRFVDAPPSTELTTYLLTMDRAKKGNNTIGLLKLYPKRIRQSTP